MRSEANIFTFPFETWCVFMQYCFLHLSTLCSSLYMCLCKVLVCISACQHLCMYWSMWCLQLDCLKHLLLTHGFVQSVQHLLLSLSHSCKLESISQKVKAIFRGWTGIDSSRISKKKFKSANILVVVWYNRLPFRT